MVIRVKAKPKKITRSKIMGVDRQYMGEEPIVVDGNDSGKYRDALNWYNYMHTADQARDWLLEHMKKSGFERAAIADVRRCPKHAVPTTMGWIARMLMNGNTLSESTMNYFNNRIDDLYRLASKTAVEDETDKPVINIQARVAARTSTLIEMVEEEIDHVMLGSTFSLYDFFIKNEVTAVAASSIRAYYLPAFEEVEMDDEQVKESYGKDLKRWKSFYKSLIDDCDRFINNKKAVKIRKPREKKAKSAVDLVKGLKFQKEEPSLKIVSVHPAEIVGCNQLWVYNTKYKKLTQYVTHSPQGIQVKGTTLTGWDTELSVSKSLRKPEITTAELLKAGKVAIRSFMSDLKTTPSLPNGRINEQTVLLRVIK